jgi:hypothetical protein
MILGCMVLPYEWEPQMNTDKRGWNTPRNNHLFFYLCLSVFICGFIFLLCFRPFFFSHH